DAGGHRKCERIGMERIPLVSCDARRGITHQRNSFTVHRPPLQRVRRFEWVFSSLLELELLSVCASRAAREFRKRKRHSITTGLFPLYSRCFIVERQLPHGIHVVANYSAITAITAYCGVDHQDG